MCDEKYLLKNYQQNYDSISDKTKTIFLKNNLPQQQPMRCTQSGQPSKSARASQLHCWLGYIAEFAES